MSGEPDFTQDGRDRDLGFDINRVDYEWIAKTSNVKELKAAYKAL